MVSGKNKLKGCWAQELTEAKRVAILLGALADDAKRQVSALEEAERDQAAKVFRYLDSLYSDNTPVPFLRSQFFSCKQQAGEDVS